VQWIVTVTCIPRHIAFCYLLSPELIACGYGCVPTASVTARLTCSAEHNDKNAASFSRCATTENSFPASKKCNNMVVSITKSGETIWYRRRRQTRRCSEHEMLLANTMQYNAILNWLVINVAATFESLCYVNCNNLVHYRQAYASFPIVKLFFFNSYLTLLFTLFNLCINCWCIKIISRIQQKLWCPVIQVKSDRLRSVDWLLN